MPQMAPTLWVPMFIFVSITMTTLQTTLYYYKKPTTDSQMSENNKPSHNWKW